MQERPLTFEKKEKQINPQQNPTLNAFKNGGSAAFFAAAKRIYARKNEKGR